MARALRFAGSDAGGERAAVAYSLIGTARRNQLAAGVQRTTFELDADRECISRKA
jgi:hypothetical protein